jgi:hypothetical protein
MPTSQPDDAFDATRARLEAMCSFMGGEEAGSLTHSEVEKRLAVDGRELLRQLYQDHLDLRAAREQRLGDVVDARGTARGTVETGHARPLMTVFGEVDVSRLAYRHRGEDNLYPADAALNLPVELHSHGLREVAAVESARGSFEEAAGAIRRATGAHCGKRQVEQLAARSAVDFEAFYESTSRAVADQRDVLALSADGKGIAMRRTQSSLSARR